MQMRYILRPSFPVLLRFSPVGQEAYNEETL